MVLVSAPEPVAALNEEPTEVVDLRRERLPVREHDPELTNRLGTADTELGEGEPITVGTIAAVQRDPGARRG